MTSDSTSVRTNTEERVIDMLGKGLPAVVVAQTLGISESRISQLMSDENIADQVRTIRYNRSSKLNERDEKADKIEDMLLEQLKNTTPLLMRPIEIARTLSIVNALKRRGASAPDSMNERSAIVTITMPKKITQQFVTNINNQVIKAGAQELLTIQSGSMEALISTSTNNDDNIKKEIGVT